MVSPRRVAQRHLQAIWLREAKSSYLKAIDFTLGLIKRLTKEGKTLPGGKNQDVIYRLMTLRQAAQQGIDLRPIVENKALLSGAGTSILKRLEEDESRLLPTQKDLVAFTQLCPAQSAQALAAQADGLGGIIAKELGVKASEVEERLLWDTSFAYEAFDAIGPKLATAKTAVVSALAGKVPGEFLSRIKDAKSSIGKQGRAGTSFLRFKDLIGCRSVVEDVRALAAATRLAQDAFDVAEKKNYFLQNTGYNAINYVLLQDGFLIEYQLKTAINDFEASLSHDLIYAKEKAIASLSDQEKKLVATVIDVSTQLSFRQWGEAFDLAVKTARV